MKPNKAEAHGGVVTDKLWSHRIAQSRLPEDFTRDDCILWIEAMTGTQPDELTDEQIIQTAERARDEQEALSIRWSSGTLLVTPLKSGRFAILDRAHQLIDIVDEFDPEDLRRWSKERETEAAQRAMLSVALGEPSDRQLARDLTVGRAAAKPRFEKKVTHVVDIEL